MSTAARFDGRLPSTARQDTRVIVAIGDDAWQPIPYWLSTPEVSGAEIAEIPFTAFAGDKRHTRQVRLIVRRVRRTPGSQVVLFVARHCTGCSSVWTPAARWYAARAPVMQEP